MAAWVLNLVYASVAALAAPWLLYRRFVQQKRFGDWRQKLLGLLPARSSAQPVIWLHAVSVGEVIQLGPVLEQLEARLPEHDFYITTTTCTGYEVACKLYPGHIVCYFPLDFSWSVNRALTRVSPAAIILVELEIWPNFISAAVRRQIPVILINGRVSERSFRSYRWIRPVLQTLLPRLTQIATQNQTYADRLISLGARRDRLEVTGSIKFDRIEASRMNPKTAEIRRAFGIGPDEAIFIAGSTQSPEEAYALDTYRVLRQQFPTLRLVLVPRHRERFDEVASLVVQSGLPLIRRSDVQAHDPGAEITAGQEPAVLLLDTLGELAACWGLADVAFVGGSLTRRGGQNMIEPAGYGAAVLFGPHTHNFKDVVAMLLDADAAQVVNNPAELTVTVRALLTDMQSAQEMGNRARQLVLNQHGATQRTVELILETMCNKVSPRTGDVANNRNQMQTDHSTSGG
ncbi:MAG: waaA [Planctomycetaceae bacterium]|nr:waaA [Planctomycetaceae bacterium]